ncbi:Tonsoku-like protein, partial [Gryllus bimaculatus]
MKETTAVKSRGTKLRVRHRIKSVVHATVAFVFSRLPKWVALCGVPPSASGVWRNAFSTSHSESSEFRTGKLAKVKMAVSSTSSEHKKARLDLLEAADVNTNKERGRTPLHRAAFDGHAESLRELLAKGADVKANDKKGWNPLHIAAEAGHPECVRELLAKGAD